MRSIVIKISLLLCIYPLSAQIQTSLYLNEAYESNPFRLPVPEASWVSTIDGGVQFNFSSLAISYNGSYTDFSSFRDRNYFWHQAAFFGSFSNTKLGIYANQRLNKNDYQIYNYNTFTGYANQSILLGSVNIFLASNLSINNYPEISEINNWEVNGSLKINKSFQTKTTIISGFAIYYKQYTTSLFYLDTLTRFSGSGNGTNSGTQSFVEQVETESPPVSQMQYWIRVAQYLTQSTGLAIQYSARKTINGKARFLPGLTYGNNQESQIFDDPMGYESQAVGMEITQILPAQLILKASSYLGQKNYTSQGTYINQEAFDTQTLRRDRYQTAHISLQKKFSVNNTRFSIQFWYRWLNNDSNSYWYDFSNNYGSLSLGVNL